MKRRLVVLLSFALVLFALAPAAVAKHGGGNGAHVAHLSGSEEVPAVDTDATGNAIFKFRDGSMHYKLIVANIENVFASHIHCGTAGVNGPVGVTLFTGSESAPNGILQQATVLAPNPGNACGWTSLDEVADAIEAGEAYVNVHTNPGVPSGEIRGQIR